MIKRFKSFSLIALAAAALVAVPASAQYTESSTGCGTFTPIAGTPGATLSSITNTDDGTELRTLPFTFMLYGDSPVTQIRISSNGQINLGTPGAPNTSNNCCSADTVVLGGSVTYARIAVAQEDLDPGDYGDVYWRDNGGSYTVSWEGVSFFANHGNVNAQAEMFPNGNVILRWDVTSTTTDNIAAGLEDDQHAPPWASPATGGVFGAGGLVSNVGANPLSGCRLFSVAPPTESICDDGVDNDGDGLTDCADPDCIGDPACAGGGGDCDLTPVIALLNQIRLQLNGIEDAIDMLETKSDRIEATVNALDAAFAALSSDIDDLQAGQCELVRLLTTPQGRRVSECDGITYSWNDNVDGD